MRIGLGRYSLMAAALCIAGPVAAGSEEKPREVNITQGSEAGWIPSEELEAEAVGTWAKYYRLLDTGQYDAAYAMLSSGLQQMWAIEEFRNHQQTLRTEIGSAVFRRPLKITWTKGGSAAPDGGTYAAIDTDAKFDEADRFCGYTILELPPGGDTFEIARIEDNFFSNSSAAQIADSNSLETPDVIWNLISRTCPNYTPPELPKSVNQSSGFASVAAARAHVKTLPGTQTGIENGWELISDEASLTVWSFSPESSPYHPSLIKRTAVAIDENTSRMEMAMLCEVTKRQCDALYSEMAARNGLLPISTE